MTIEFNLESPKSISVQAPSDVTTVVAQQPTQTVTVSGVVAGAAGPAGADGADGQGLIVGGTENEFLQKNSATDYDTKWSAYTLPGADGDDGQVLTTDGAGTVSFAFPKTIAEDVKNVSGGTLSKGTPVHVTGSVGNLAEVIAADAATNYPAHFVLNEDIADDGEGLGIALGFINNVDVPDASIYTEGQTVYLGETPGTFTTTKPTGTNAIQNLGVIIKVNTSGNKISGIIMGAGRSNDVPNIPNGQTWIGNASGVATPTTLATVATTGAYSDLSGTPTIPSGDLVDDTTPQLGGDLDVNGNKITSASNGDITIEPDGDGAIIFKSDNIQFDGGGTFQGKIRLYESDVLGSNYIALAAPLGVTSDITFTFPDGVGSNGQVLSSNGAGGFVWITPLSETDPDFQGNLEIRRYSTIEAQLSLFDYDNDNFIGLRAPTALTADTVFILPSSDGSSGQVLKTDGSGNLSFTSVGTVGTTGTPIDSQVAVFTNANTIEGDANFAWNGTKLTVAGEMVADKVAINQVGLTSVGDFGSGSRVLSRVGTDTTVTVGDVYYLGSSAWIQADADAVSTASGLIGVAVASSTNDGVLVSGAVKVADNTGFSSSAVGTVLYLDTTAGHVTATAPSGTGDVVRVVGYVLNGSSGIIYFDPSKDWIELS